MRAEVALAGELNDWLAGVVPRVSDLGIRAVELEVGRVVMRASLDGLNGNHLGSMYAGTLFGMAEAMGGVLLWPSFDFTEYLPTVKEVTIRYRRSARTDITGTASVDAATLERIRREVSASGRSEYVVDTVLTDSGGQVVASTHGTYQLLATALTRRPVGEPGERPVLTS